MSRISLIALLVLLSGVGTLTAASSCTVTRVGEGEGEGGGNEGEGEGGGGEGEGGGGLENTDALCSDGIDNDGNNFTDCDDFACSGLGNCKETAGACVAAGNCCSDGIDNDGNTFTDCEDFACSGDATHPADPACVVAGAVSIQDVQDGTHGPGTTVTIDSVVVTGVKVAGSGNVTLFVQEPDGVTTAGHTYPEFAGVGLFIKSTDVATFPDVNGIAIGDCVTVTGKITEFQGQTQLSFITAFATSGGCGADPTPVVEDVAAVGDSGPDAEKYEGALVTVNDVTVSTASTGNSGSFEVTATGGADTLFISGFLLATPPAETVGDHFASITGVLTEFDNVTDPANPIVQYNLEPRIAGDLVH